MGTTFTEDELNHCSKETLIKMFLSTQEQMTQMNKNIELLVEQLSIANQKRFGRSTEKLEIEGQLTLTDCFNEAEVIADTSASISEPEMEEICPHSYKRHKQKGKREEDLKGIEIEEVLHELTEESSPCCLERLAGNGFLTKFINDWTSIRQPLRSWNIMWQYMLAEMIRPL